MPTLELHPPGGMTPLAGILREQAQTLGRLRQDLDQVQAQKVARTPVCHTGGHEIGCD